MTARPDGGLVLLGAAPALFYVAMFHIGGTFGLLMVVAGRFSLAEAKAFVLFGQPPQRWAETAC